jgi:SAM-dependent methyltransferase
VGHSPLLRVGTGGARDWLRAVAVRVVHAAKESHAVESRTPDAASAKAEPHPTPPGCRLPAGRPRLSTLRLVPLHPLAVNFAEVAGAYERGRPEYPLAVVGALAAELRIEPGAAVLDLAAGTGKLTRTLLDAGLDVVAVEPQAQLREILAARVGGERVREGLAEAIPLPDASVAAVTVADAFHWFDQALALEELRRVLRPGGGLAVVSTVPDWSGASWAHELGTLMAGLRPAHPHYDGPPWQDSVRTVGGWTTPREIRMTTMQPARPERIVDYLGSISWIAALLEDKRNKTLEQIDAIVRAGDTPAELPVHVQIGLTALV